MIAAIEVHNKPLFTYRYEVCTLLVINAWELIFKAYINKNLKHVKLFFDDGKTKPFEECLGCIASELGNRFIIAKESIEKLYAYRNSIAHFYSDNLDIVIYSLLKPNVEFYVAFIKESFGIDLIKETGLILLPIGFYRPYSPIDFLSIKSNIQNSSVEIKSFIESIIDTSKRLLQLGIEDSILVDFKMNIINENRIKNADLIAGINNSNPQNNLIKIYNFLSDVTISDDPNAKKIKIEETSLLDDLYTETYHDVVENCKTSFFDFKRNNQFAHIMASLKDNPDFHYIRYLNPKTKKGGSRDYYSKAVYKELEKHYTRNLV